MDTKALRQKILDLAIHGKLVPQDPNDEPASFLLERIRAEKQQMVKDGKLKAKDIKNDTVIFKGDDNLHYEQFADGTVKCIEDEIPFELPDGWAWARLGNIGEWKAGATPNRKCLEYYNGDIPWVKTGDLNDDYIKEIPETITKKALKETSVSIIPKDTVLIAMYGATIGKLGITTCDVTTNQACCACCNLKGVNKKFLFYFLMQHKSNFISMGFGGAQPNISKEKIVQVIIPIPPIEEQNKITAKLTELFTFVKKIESDKSTLQSTIQQTKSKILDLAIRGKLVPQDPNDEPASVLLERIRAEKEELIKQGKIKRDKKESVIFKGDDNSYYQDLPQNWQVSTLREITTSLTLNDGDWILSENMTDNGEVKLLQLGSIGNMSYIDKGFKYLTKHTFDKLSCTEIFTGYLIINRIISDKMCCCIVPDIDGTIITTVDTCWIAPSETSYDIKFLMYQLASPSFQSAVLLKATGTTRKRISKNNLIDLHLLLPPLAEQKRIVNTIEALFAQIDKISEQIL
ncbi:MAG: restriction endonuclease subunit S [Firmicutes bacterium]|nr:restriction endonuclease subunit S [Bacillota bacterium]